MAYIVYLHDFGIEELHTFSVTNAWAAIFVLSDVIIVTVSLTE